VDEVLRAEGPTELSDQMTWCLHHPVLPAAIRSPGEAPAIAVAAWAARSTQARYWHRQQPTPAAMAEAKA